MKIKIIKYHISDNNYCYECGRDDRFLAVGATNWEEITQEEYGKISNSICLANGMIYNKKRLII